MSIQTDLQAHIQNTLTKFDQFVAGINATTPDINALRSIAASGRTDIINARNKANLLIDMYADLFPYDIAPVAVDDTLETDKNVSFTFARSLLPSNDTDADDTNLTVASVQNFVNCTVEWVNSATLRFIPNTDFEGIATFEYTVIDPHIRADTGVVTVLVGEQAEPPFEWPDATNSGVPDTVVLSAYTGSYDITTNNAVIEGKIFNAMPVIYGQNVTLRNCLIQHNDIYGVNANDAGDGTEATIENCTIIGPGVNGAQNAGVLGYAHVKNCDISGSGLAVNIKGTALQLTGNHIHDLGWYRENETPHYDGIVCQGGLAGATIEDNAIHMPMVTGTGAITLSPHAGWGNISNVTINHNLCTGSPAFSIFVEKRLDGTAPTGCVVTNNHVAPGDYNGYIAIVDCTVTRSGNVDYQTGVSVD